MRVMPEPEQPDPRGHLKGVVFREFVAWFEAAHGHTEALRIYQNVPSAVAVRLEVDATRPAWGILPSRWYEARDVHVLLDLMLDGRSESERGRLVDEGADAVIEKMLTGVYRTFFKLLVTPNRYAKYAQNLWSLNFDTGRLEVEIVNPRRSESQIVDWAGHHPFLCDVMVRAGTAIFSAMGCKDVVGVRTRCVSHGATACTRVFTWR
jgi:hypothetical protein